MKRGFLNTPRSKRAIEQAYTPQPPPGPSPPLRKKAAVVEDATDDSDDASNAGNRVFAVRTTRDESGAKLPPKDSGDGYRHIQAPPTVATEKKDESNGTDASSDDDSDRVVLRRPPRRRPGWGRHPDDEFLHTVPPSHGGPDRKRAVFCLWPRDPKGKPLMPSEEPRGKLSPDGYPWGATLYDFYHVHRLPTCPTVNTIMTGSAIWQVMREMGELDAAAPEIKWAESEGELTVEGAADTAELIECVEVRAGMGFFNRYSMREDVREAVAGSEQATEDASHSGSDSNDEDGEDDEQDEDDDGEDDENDDGKDESDDEEGEDTSEHGDEAQNQGEIKHDGNVEVDAPVPPPSTRPITPPFDPSHYPKPWPFIPFTAPLSVLLQQRIPLYLLPQTLYVHDPFVLLRARDVYAPDASWTSRPDVVKTYNLKVSELVRTDVEAARQKAEELEEFKARTLIMMRYKRTKEQIENHEPIVEVPLPPYPRRMTRVEESHLYLSPIAKVGQGHHSLVYRAEWELPRDLFIRPKICQHCFEDSAEKEIERLKSTGRWEKMLRAAAWGPKGFTGRQPTRAELDEVSDPVNLEKNGEIIEREITFIVPPNMAPSQILGLVDNNGLCDMFMKRKENSIRIHLEGEEPEEDSYVATIRIDLPFSYESQKACTHGLHRFAVPRMAKFEVAAKLSLQYDSHLVREASNYQQFPKHLFQHYDGYALISQLHCTVPLHAVVPQFYGYYIPTEEEKNKRYLSPILLLEDCGQPIEPENLTLEDQEECASLLLRFHRAGWLQESVAPRNFLVQLGKPTQFPLMRMANPEPSFRLIDFGRSERYSTAEEKRVEEFEALKMFAKLHGRMNLTFAVG